MFDRLIRSGLSIVWHNASGILWSPRVVRAVSAVVNAVPQPGTYRVRYKGTYLYATTLDRFVALNLWKYGVLEAEELRFAHALIRPGMHIVDIGANVGFHSLEFARWTGPNGTVDAFEPAPDNHAVLQRNISASGLSNVTAHELAIADRVGQTQMYLSPIHRGDHRIVAPEGDRQSIAVRTATMDSLYADRRIDFVKIDAQGAEYLVLAGMREVMRNNPSLVVMLEFCPQLMSQSGHSPNDLIGLLGEFNRRIMVVDHERRRYVDCDAQMLSRKAAAEPQIDLLLSAPGAADVSLS